MWGNKRWVEGNGAGYMDKMKALLVGGDDLSFSTLIGAGFDGS